MRSPWNWMAFVAGFVAVCAPDLIGDHLRQKNIVEIAEQRSTEGKSQPFELDKLDSWALETKAGMLKIEVEMGLKSNATAQAELVLEAARLREYRVKYFPNVGK